MKSQTIKEILEALTPSKREQLMTAFELDFAQIVQIEGDSLYIGVNVDTIKNFHTIQSAGVWAVGTLTSPEKYHR